MELQVQSSEQCTRFAHGDLDAFEELFYQYQREVYGWVLRVVRDRAAAEDLTIEVFWRIYRARASFNPARSFGAWARRIATNVAVDYLKNTPAEVALLEDCTSAEESDITTRQEVRDVLERIFRQLPIKLQVVARLALIEELPYREISEALGISEGAVKLRIFRATRILRKRLKEAGIEP